MVEVVITIDFEVHVKNIEVPKITGSKNKSYIEAMINHLVLHQKNTPNMSSADSNSGILSLAGLVLLHGNDGQGNSDGLPKLFVGQNWPPAAAATGKHRHGASTMRHAFT
jgi:hypothetical protein